MNARAIISMLALVAGMAHADEIPHAATLKLHLDIMREYPTVGQPAQTVRTLCTMTAEHAERLMALRVSGMSSEALIHQADDNLVSGNFTAKMARFSNAVTAYVYALPMLQPATVRYDTLKNCLMALEN